MKFYYRTLYRGFVLIFLAFGSVFSSSLWAQESVAREWNEVLLEAIRLDYARPTVHARNLWHTSVVLYDAWAVYDDDAHPYFLGNTIDGFTCVFDGVLPVDDATSAQNEAMSYAAYRLLSHRFSTGPGFPASQIQFNIQMAMLGYDIGYESTDYINGGPAALGNYIAEQMIAFGLQDGSNEQGDYGNLYYEPVNEHLIMDDEGNPNLSDPNRWQPLTVTQFIDQSGNELTESPEFLSPEWGEVSSFSLQDSMLTEYERDGYEYQVYCDPGAPPYLDTTVQSGLEDLYKWNFVMVAIWSSHLDPNDDVMLDASPNSIGNIAFDSFPTEFENYDTFYNYLDGGHLLYQGYDINPATGEPYEEQMVPRADYARILAEFWADGPDSETPPGHWFTILNYVSEHEMFTPMWGGEGEEMDPTEWYVKSYFALGACMHDVAITAWGIKGWYDYIRPVSAIRYMCDLGQSTDITADNYHPGGIPLIPGYVETIEEGDMLAGDENENVGRIKIKGWRGPDFIEEPEVDLAGVDWILGEYWWPYQRPTFVTPPFAGYVSGHSTYSRAAAELMTLMTGDPYFPGGMGEFLCPQNEFLVFEQGPSVDVTLQWATYRDASDQCSLSRIWGGIHPPADDIPGRLIGAKLGPHVWDYAQQYLAPTSPKITSLTPEVMMINDDQVALGTFTLTAVYDQEMDMMTAPEVTFPMDDPALNTLVFDAVNWVDANTVEISYVLIDANETLDNIWVKITGGVDIDGESQKVYLDNLVFEIDTENPLALTVDANLDMISDGETGDEMFTVDVVFSELMNTDETPAIEFPTEDVSGTLVLDADNSSWGDDQMSYTAVFDVIDEDIEVDDVDMVSISAKDVVGNTQVENELIDAFDVDTKNPAVAILSASTYLVSNEDLGLATFYLLASFDEDMDTSLPPTFMFPEEDPTGILTLNSDQSEWINNSTYVIRYDVADVEEIIPDIDVNVEGVTDIVGNDQISFMITDFFDIDLVDVGIVEVSGAFDDLMIYPNPVSYGMDLIIETADLKNDVVFSLYGSNGQLVEVESEVSESRIVVSTDQLAPGMYHVRLVSPDGSATFKVQVNK